MSLDGGFIWLASYPKSGNTWLRLLLQSCLDGGGAVPINAARLGVIPGLDRALFDEAIGVPAADLSETMILRWRPWLLRDVASRLSEPVFAKTHAAQTRLPDGDWLHPPEVSLAALALVRDPRDVALSLARHIERPVDEAIALMAERGCRTARSLTALRPQLVDPWGGWSENVASWIDQVAIPVTLIRYEDLRADPYGELRRVLAALGLEIPTRTVSDAVAACGLERLRREEEAQGFREWRGRDRFFGEGRVGGWRGRLTKAQVARIERDHGTMMRRLGYERHDESPARVGAIP